MSAFLVGFAKGGFLGFMTVLAWFAITGVIGFGIGFAIKIVRLVNGW